RRGLGGGRRSVREPVGARDIPRLLLAGRETPGAPAGSSRQPRRDPRGLHEARGRQAARGDRGSRRGRRQAGGGAAARLRFRPPDREPPRSEAVLVLHGARERWRGGPGAAARRARGRCPEAFPGCGPAAVRARRDRKSTRLNSSHVKISYAVFCLKKKNRPRITMLKVT